MSVAVEADGRSLTAAVVAVVVDEAAVATTYFDRQRPGRTWPRPQCCSSPFYGKKNVNKGKSQKVTWS